MMIKENKKIRRIVEWIIIWKKNQKKKENF